MPCRGACGACSRSSARLSSLISKPAAQGRPEECGTLPQEGAGKGPGTPRWLGHCSGQAHGKPASWERLATAWDGNVFEVTSKRSVKARCPRPCRENWPAGKHLRLFRVVTADEDVLRALSDLSYKKHQADVIVRREVRASLPGLLPSVLSPCNLHWKKSHTTVLRHFPPKDCSHPAETTFSSRLCLHFCFFHF